MSSHHFLSCALLRLSSWNVNALLICSLCLLAGCGGESAESRMRKRATAVAKLNEEKAKKIAASENAEPVQAEHPAPATAEVVATRVVPVPSNSQPATLVPPPISPAAKTASPPTGLTVEQRRAKTIENLTKIGRALKAFEGKYAGFPATQDIVANKMPPMSWRVAILPLLGYDNLFKQYRNAEPWNSAANKLVLAQIPPEFQSPERGDTKTNYLLPLNTEAAFGDGRRLSSSQFEDGPESTIVILEVDDAYAVEWTKPEDIVLQDVPKKSRLGSLRGDGFFAVLGSGRVCRVATEANEEALHALLTISAADHDKMGDFVHDAEATVAAPAPTEPATLAVSPAPGSDTKAADNNSTIVPAPNHSVRNAATINKANSVPDSSLPLARQSIPSDAELSRAREEIRNLFAADYKLAESREERIELARKLVSAANDAGKDAPAAYELLRIARELFAACGDLAGAMDVVTAFHQRFEIDELEMRLDTLKLVQKATANAGAKAEPLASHVWPLLYACLHADRYDFAEEVLRMVIASARKGQDASELPKALEAQKWVEASKKLYRDVPSAEQKLKVNADDSAANHAVGSYLCLVKGRWEAGLPHLEKTHDPQLKLLAKLDLISTKSVDEILDLADQYWDTAQGKADLEQRGLRLRAAYWYSLALKSLPAGLRKIKSQKRIDEVRAAYGKESLDFATGAGAVATIEASSE